MLILLTSMLYKPNLNLQYMCSDLRIICPQNTLIILVFSKNMTRFKNYSYLMVDRKVLKRCIVGIENSCLKAAFCSRVLYCVSSKKHEKLDFFLSVLINN